MWGQIDRIDIRCLLCLWTCCTVHGHSALDTEIDLPTSWQTSPCTRCHSSAPPQLVLSGAVPRAEHLRAGGQNQCESPDRGTQKESKRALPVPQKCPDLQLQQPSPSAGPGCTRPPPIHTPRVNELHRSHQTGRSPGSHSVILCGRRGPSLPRPTGLKI
jgi:hypothetical protein